LLRRVFGWYKKHDSNLKNYIFIGHRAMKTAYQFEAEGRSAFGTGGARAVRNSGKVPAVLYGGQSEPVHFAVTEKDIKREYLKGGFFGKVVTLNIDGKAIYGVPCDVQTHPVSDRIIHADFYRVEAGSEVKVTVPVKFINSDRCIGIRRGGALNVVRYSLELFCQPDAIPEMIEVDLLKLNIGDSVHISHVALPAGARPTIERDFTIAAVAGRASKVAGAAETGDE
jgi:large subunit ribosomal protein L25